MNGFILYSEHYEAVKSLSLEQKGLLLDCLYRYAIDGTEPTGDDPLVALAFAFLRASMDAARAKYDAKCARMRENGRKGGAPKGNANAKKEVLEEGAEAPLLEKLSSPPPYGDIMHYWNDRRTKVGSTMRAISLMTDARRALIRARLKDCGGDVETIYKAIDNALASHYLNGGNKERWQGTFDWIMSAKNFAKVLDGNYADTNGPPPSEMADADLATAIKEASEAQTLTMQMKMAKERKRMLDYIATIERTQNKFLRDTLVNAYRSGYLRRLGITWKPEGSKKAI